MKKGILRLCFLLLLIISTKGFAILEYNRNIETAHKYILEFKINKAKPILLLEKSKNPKNAYVNYLLSYQLFIDSYFTAEDKVYHTFIENSEACIEQLKSEKKKEIANILVSTLYIQRAFIFFLWSKHLSYANALIKGRSAILEINEDSKNLEYLKIRALYELTGGSVPSKYKTLANWLGIEGESSKSIALIDKYISLIDIKSARGIEGQIIKLYIYNFLDISSDKFSEKHIKNPLLAYTYIQSSGISAKEKLSIISALAPNLPSYFTYLKAKSELETQNRNGLMQMDNFLTIHKGNSLIHSAHLLKYKYYIAQNMLEEARKEKKIILNLKDPIFPKDKSALNDIEKPYNSMLLKARMLFDAQDYDKALRVLNTIKPSLKLITNKEKLEYKYRLARIYEETEKTSLALKLFKEVIESKESKYYFVSYSAYRVGRILTKQNKPEQAKKYFKLALELNDGEYQISIENKCLFALKRLHK